MLEKPAIFISYRRRDAGGYARALHEYLSGRFGDDRVFFDRNTIESGDVFPDTLCQGVEGCAALLALIGPEWLDGRRLEDADDFVRQEIALALEQGKKVIPVLFDDTPVPSRDRLPDPLQALASCDALTLRGKTYEYQTQRRELVRLLAKVPGVPAPFPEVSTQWRPAKELSWEQLCKICNDSTRRSMATVQRKYQKRLYLQRNTVRHHVDAFLADPTKRGFVLVGKSGVGKSNFLLALNDELHAKSNVCVMMYDGANIPITSSSLTEIITRDLRSQVVSSRQTIREVWEEIALIENIGERLVVFCVDAVNENTQSATELLRQLDALVRSPWPWLKIIFSSRPETWRSIKSNVKLSEALYYREPESDRIAIELEPFSYSAPMEIFLYEELPDAYRKYQIAFDLQPDYRDLSHELREVVRDPLNLMLLSRRYRKQIIPPTVQPSALIEEYVNWVLRREERRFLENQLVSLMVRHGQYNNVITEAEIDEAGDDLFEMIHSDHVLSDGKRRNQGFLNICDADILVLEKYETRDLVKRQRIKFKYERFYEYFAGRRLANLGETQADRYIFFLELIKESTGKPFLWGAVRNALVKEAEQSTSEIIVKLCRTTEQPVKEMMVNVLIALGLDSPEQVQEVLRNSIVQERQASEWQKIRYLVSKSDAKADLRTRNARKIAIEVASALRLGWVLQAFMRSRDPTMRAMAVRYSYYLWQRDRAAGFAVVQYISEKVTTGVIPDFLALESLFGLSLIIVCNSYRDEKVLKMLQGIWHGMIAKLFRVRDDDIRWKGIIRDFVIERVISFVIVHVLSLVRELPPNSMMRYDDIEAFFRLKPEEKQLYRRLVRYFDVTGDYSMEQMEQDYLAVLEIDNALLRMTTIMGLVAHAWVDPHAFLPFLTRLFEAARHNVETYPYLRVIQNVPVSLLQRDPKLNGEIFNFFVYTSDVSKECYAKHPEKYQGEASGPPPQVSGIGSYITFQYRRERTVKTAWLETRIKEALKERDIELFDFLLSAEFPDQAINNMAPKAVLAALELFFKSGNAAITGKIEAFLSRLRLYYPEQVEEFLAEQQAPDEFCLQVRTHEPNEKVGDLIGLRAWYFVRDSALLGPATRCAQLIALFEKAAEYSDTRAWMNYVIRRLINLIYGGQAVRESG